MTHTETREIDLAATREEVAEAVRIASTPGFWTGYTEDEKQALLGLTYHAIDQESSGFTGSHAKTILALMVKMSRREVTP